ncbi:MAG: hypothetical protein M3401_10450 [Actinomycetota bacterium]|nr:hypothetical protein [Actinomycetota bacterium]
MSRLAQRWQNTGWGRPIALALLVMWVALSVSAAFPQDADAALPLLIGGGLLVAGFLGGDKIVGAAGELVLKGVQAVLDWIYGGLKDTITPFVMEFLTRVDLVFEGGLERLVVPLVVIGAALMVLGAVSSVIQGYGAVIAGTASSASIISGVLMRVAGLALLLGSWHTLVPIAVDVANEFSAYVLTDEAVKDALAKTFGLSAAGGASAGIAAAGVAPIVLVILLTLLAICFIVLLLLKYVVIFAFAVLYLGGPVMIGLGAFPGLGSVAVNALVRSLAILMLIPLAWATVFAAWAAVNSTLVTNPPKEAGAYALTVINGPGIFVASCLVVIGVTRVLTKMATPLGAPLNIPGARLAMAAAAYKAAPALWSKFGAAAEGLPGAEAVAEHNSRYDGTPYHHAVAASAAWDGPVSDGMNLAVAGGGGASDTTPDVVSGGQVVDDAATAPAGSGRAPRPSVIGGTAHGIANEPRPTKAQMPELPAGAPDFDAARARITDQGAVSSEQVASALEHLDDDERAHVRDAGERARAVQQAAGGDEGDVHFREQIAAGMTDGRTFRPDSQRHAAVIGAGSHQAALDALHPPADATTRPAHDEAKYTERELRRDWTEPIAGDEERGRR